MYICNRFGYVASPGMLLSARGYGGGGREFIPEQSLPGGREGESVTAVGRGGGTAGMHAQGAVKDKHLSPKGAKREREGTSDQRMLLLGQLVCR